MHRPIQKGQNRRLCWPCRGTAKLLTNITHVLTLEKDGTDGRTETQVGIPHLCLDVHSHRMRYYAVPRGAYVIRCRTASQCNAMHTATCPMWMHFPTNMCFPQQFSAFPKTFSEFLKTTLIIQPDNRGCELPIQARMAMDRGEVLLIRYTEGFRATQTLANRYHILQCTAVQVAHAAVECITYQTPLQ